MRIDTWVVRAYTATTSILGAWALSSGAERLGEYEADSLHGNPTGSWFSTPCPCKRWDYETQSISACHSGSRASVRTGSAQPRNDYRDRDGPIGGRRRRSQGDRRSPGDKHPFFDQF